MIYYSLLIFPANLAILINMNYSSLVFPALIIIVVIFL